MTYSPSSRPTVAEVALACSNRHSGNDVDYVRAVFAVLSLNWQAHWTHFDGMKALIEALSEESVTVAALHGPRAMESPYGWASSVWESYTATSLAEWRVHR